VKTYEYVAVDARGKAVVGTTWARGEIELDYELEMRGLLLTKSKEVARRRRSANARMTRGELVHFTNQLSTVVGAGVPIIEGLSGIGQRLASPPAKRLIEEMVGSLRAGQSFSTAMDAYPGTFPGVYRASVRAGEASGSLDTILDRLARHLEWTRAMRATTIQALIYPAILSTAIVGLICILLTFLLPRILQIYPGGPEDLPGQTRLVIAVSDFLLANGLWILAFLAAAAVALVWTAKRPRGRLVLDGLLLRFPRLGTLVTQLATSKFACTAGILQSAGCDIFTIMSISAATCGNAALAAAFLRGAERVRVGERLSDALAIEPRMDALLIQMLSVGEKTGALDRCLDRLVRYYDEEVPRSVKKFLALLEPTILVGAGGLVAFILLAALLPMFDLYNKMS
jgi:general secretion pathway protein F